jgi:adenylate cyclase
MRLLPNIRYGTERYPEKVARRLRALNIAAWVGAGITGGFAIVQFLDPTPGLWKVATVNALAAPLWAAIPLLHRVGPWAAPPVLLAFAYAYFFVVIFLLGTGTGMQLYYLAGAALTVLFFGTEQIALASVFSVAAAAFIITLQLLVPYNTGLQSSATQFGNFIATVVASCVILLLIVFYALREAARAEAAAEREYERSESLLVNILPAPVAARLKDQPESIIADEFADASILFADMAGFTARASDTSPNDLVQFLNRVFTDFDRLVERHGLEKIKTTGDAYMVVSGVPVPRPDHTQALAQLALEMRDAATELRDPNGCSVPIRIGIASGPVVAGVVGTRKFFYDIWGDAVNVASRMESTGVAGRIQVSQQTYERLRDDFVLEAHGEIDVRGKGRMRTWFLVDRKADAAAPTMSDASAVSVCGSHDTLAAPGSHDAAEAD